MDYTIKNKRLSIHILKKKKNKKAVDSLCTVRYNEKEMKTYVHNKGKRNMTRSAGRYRPIWEGDFALC